MISKNFSLWVGQSVEDLKRHKKTLEESKAEVIKPYDAQIAKVNQIIQAMEGGSTGIVKPKPRKSKGFKYNGTHWTQRPGGAQKMSAASRKAWSARRGGM